MANPSQQLKTSIRGYLSEAYICQLSTTHANQPWVCSVYFVADKDMNLYWLSWPTRRHSIELANNPKAAITMAIKTDQPIIGLGAEGTVDIVDDVSTVEKVMGDYIAKYGSGKDFVERYKKGINEHELYKFKPVKYVLIDEVNYLGEGSKDFFLRK